MVIVERRIRGQLPARIQGWRPMTALGPQQTSARVWARHFSQSVMLLQPVIQILSTLSSQIGGNLISGEPAGDFI